MTKMTYRNGLSTVTKAFIILNIIYCLALFYAILGNIEASDDRLVFPSEYKQGYSDPMYKNRPYAVRY
jgi:hypothetical protein